MVGETAEQSGDDDSQLGDRWGDDILPKRQAQLEEQFSTWTREAGRKPVYLRYSRSRLTGADVYWLAARTLANSADEESLTKAKAVLAKRQFMLSTPYVSLSNLCLENENLAGAHLEGAVFREAYLEGTDLRGAHLKGADLRRAHLKGADLMAAHLEGADLMVAHLERAVLTRAHLERAGLTAAHLEDTGLMEARLEEASLWAAHLERAVLMAAHLEGADLMEAHLEGADLRDAHLEGSDLTRAHLEGADLRGAHLKRAVLKGAHLEGADLREAHLEGADLRDAHLQGRRFREDDANFQRIQKWKPDFHAVLPPADLRLAFLDQTTQLHGAIVGDADLGYLRVADTHWGDANLAVVDWGDTPNLQDERAAKEWKPPKPEPSATPQTQQTQREAQQKQRAVRLDLYRAATRANRQLATVLRTQGLNDEADRFAYRAQVLQRTVLRLQRRRVRWAFSGLMDALAGYGYKPERTLYDYLTAILGFATAYFILGQAVGPHLSPLGSVVFSMTSFHGRGFFPGGIALDDPITVLAAAEAFIGLIIEVSFIATFTQRFFAR